jgi:hypothetical protein
VTAYKDAILASATALHCRVSALHLCANGYTQARFHPRPSHAVQWAVSVPLCTGAQVQSLSLSQTLRKDCYLSIPSTCTAVAGTANPNPNPNWSLLVVLSLTQACHHCRSSILKTALPAPQLPAVAFAADASCHIADVDSDSDQAGYNTVSTSFPLRWCNLLPRRGLQGCKWKTASQLYIYPAQAASWRWATATLVVSFCCASCVTYE